MFAAWAGHVISIRQCLLLFLIMSQAVVNVCAGQIKSSRQSVLLELSCHKHLSLFAAWASNVTSTRHCLPLELVTSQALVDVFCFNWWRHKHPLIFAAWAANGTSIRDCLLLELVCHKHWSIFAAGIGHITSIAQFLLLDLVTAQALSNSAIKTSHVASTGQCWLLVLVKAQTFVTIWN